MNRTKRKEDGGRYMKGGRDLRYNYQVRQQKQAAAVRNGKRKGVGATEKWVMQFKLEALRM